MATGTRGIKWGAIGRSGMGGGKGEEKEGKESKRGGGHICGIIEHRVLFSFNYNHVKNFVVNFGKTLALNSF